MITRTESLLIRLLLLHEAATGYTNLSFAEVLEHARRWVSWIFERGHLEVIDPSSTVIEQKFPVRGRVTGGYGISFSGPPYPVYVRLVLPNTDDPDELRMAALYCDYLFAALQAAGYREELDRQARYDWLTGLGNQRALERRLKGGLPADWGVAFLDLDNLKRVNDSQGHLAGDQLLQRFANALRQAAFEAFRLGGDEFVVLLTRQQKAALLEAISHFQVSYGFAWADEDECTNLLQRADQRMYAQKYHKKTSR
ncbi:GGDEF domain-containing protein [Chloroflexus sp.]|uniref:GGDEF domain-containing protein n=1 Tax=Chloroflexus sp. TaxID=1904827 RepID=UPI002ADDC93B|nr:GGDEF domain-containing protein [Chloroflexus sp.]